MRLLLDTHVIIWLALDRLRLPRHVVHAVEASDELIISLASAWEYGIKRRKHPAKMPSAFPDLLAGLPTSNLGLDYALYRYAESLPPIHNDPFDRMLIAQALDLDLTLVTEDSDIHQYDVRTLW